MYGLHNTNLLRKTIPQSLTAPQPIYEDHRSHHDQIAIKLRQNQAEKRKRTQEKQKATLAQKAKKTSCLCRQILWDYGGAFWWWRGCNGRGRRIHPWQWGLDSNKPATKEVFANRVNLWLIDLYYKIWSILIIIPSIFSSFPLVYLRIVHTDLKSDRRHTGIAGNNPIKTKNAQMQLTDKYQSQLRTSSSQSWSSSASRSDSAFPRCIKLLAHSLEIFEFLVYLSNDWNQNVLGFLRSFLKGQRMEGLRVAFWGG